MQAYQQARYLVPGTLVKVPVSALVQFTLFTTSLAAAFETLQCILAVSLDCPTGTRGTGTKNDSRFLQYISVGSSHGPSKKVLTSD